MRQEMIERDQIDGIVASAGVEIAAEIMDAFWRSTDKLMTDMAEALKNGSLKDAAGFAHGLKGSAANVGAMAIFDETQIFETFCNTNDERAAEAALEKIITAVDKSREAFVTYFKNAAA